MKSTSQKKNAETSTYWPETTIVWDAGATVNLGLLTTDGLGTALSRLAGTFSAPPNTSCALHIPNVDHNREPVSLKERISKTFGDRLDPNDDLFKELQDLLLLLYDGDESTNEPDAYNLWKKTVTEAKKKYRTNGSTLWLKRNLENLHRQYDWVGVRSVIQYVSRKHSYTKPAFSSIKSFGWKEEVNLMDLLTTIDQLIETDMGIPTKELFHKKGTPDDSMYFIDKKRLANIRTCILHLIGTLQRINFSIFLKKMEKGDEKNSKRWEQYKKFAEALVSHTREETETLKSEKKLKIDSREFYLFSHAFISFNWDPILQWLIFKKHRKYNRSKPPSIHQTENGKSSQIKFFNDSGDGIGIIKIDGDKDDRLAFMMNEQACRAVNNVEYIKTKGGRDPQRILRIGKMLFPHGGFSWRQCPRCGKIFCNLGPKFSKDKYPLGAFGPDIIPGIPPKYPQEIMTSEEKACHTEGEFGAIECIFCGEITRPHNTPLTLQSAIKGERHFILDGIYREMGLLFQNSSHLLLIGYSLPPDDFLYRCYLQSARASKQDLYVSVVDYDYTLAHKKDEVKNERRKHVSELLDGRWLYGHKILDYLEISKKHAGCCPSMRKHLEPIIKTLSNMLEVFNYEQMRLSVSGFPDVILGEKDEVDPALVKDLLYPTHWPKLKFDRFK